MPRRDGAEQRARRATRRQLDADARELLDHAARRSDQALADGRELRRSPSGSVCGIAARTSMHQPDAAVWSASRT